MTIERKALHAQLDEYLDWLELRGTVGELRVSLLPAKGDRLKWRFWTEEAKPWRRDG